MKYLIIGAGGTGGAIAGYMGRVGKDVTVIARGEHLQAIQRNGGLQIFRPRDEFFAPVYAFDMEHYQEKPDVIFVCVKSYSVEDCIPFIRRIAGARTIVIPILNVFGTGAEMQKKLPGIPVTDGCIYVASEKKGPGSILMSGLILRVVFGLRKNERADLKEEQGGKKRLLEQIRDDLEESRITGILSDDIERDALLKFSYVSPQGACGLYYGIPVGPMQKKGKYRDTYAELVHEVDLLAKAMGISFEEDIVKRNLEIMDALAPTMTTSLQKDVAAGHRSEIDGLIYRVVRLAKQYGIDLPAYETIALELMKKDIK